MSDFDQTSLVDAIRKLFELNHYDVAGPVQIHGAEVDIVATPMTDPFGSPIYLEATVEYVNNDKYGKDVGKLAMIGELERNAQRLIVSSKGFSLPVLERAKATRIETFTYDELFQKFERFDKYLTGLESSTPYGRELHALSEIYEEPFFDDASGRDRATDFLTSWRDQAADESSWLVIIGEYGTGKTALTKMLQYRWTQEYKKYPGLPLTFRLELREFTRQFDARGLLHHFLDRNGLQHISLDFVLSLIRSGRIVLLLDGYDEMAQYLHARERRSCLEALAELSAGGAKGILTSRPNYFTEAEELQVFDILYASLEHGRYFLGREGAALVDRERQIDKLLGQFFERYERTLQDLTPQQTEDLVGRVLAHDRRGKVVILRILRRILRSSADGSSQSLSGKPVIISYLLEIVEGLKASQSDREGIEPLSEWQVYKMIIDQLMLRDLKRSPEITPNERRSFLWRLATHLSQREKADIDQEEFKDLIAKEFRRQLARLPSDSRGAQVDRYFADLRSSATLTRSVARDISRWRFSHNSIREFLAAEFMTNQLRQGSVADVVVPITDPMRIFVASRPSEDIALMLQCLTGFWKTSQSSHAKGQYLSLLWTGVIGAFASEPDPCRSALAAISGEPVALNGISLSRLTFSLSGHNVDLSRASFNGAELSSIDLSEADLSHSDFSNAVLETVNFSGANLQNAKFCNAALVDVNFSGVDVVGADCRGLDSEFLSILVEPDDDTVVWKRLDGDDAIGFLNFNGARTDVVSDSKILQHHPKFSIVRKIIEKLSEQSLRQRRGLVQRGAARADVPFARDFVELLEGAGFVRSPIARKDLVEVTNEGKDIFQSFVRSHVIPPQIVEFLRRK